MRTALFPTPARLIGAFLMLLFLALPVSADAREAKEDARIQHIISAVEKLEGAFFIRNGSDYDPKAAASHLRMKLKKAGDRVKTAEDFIDGIAANSSTSGKPYQIRMADGTVTDTGPYLRSRLREYDKAHP